MTLSFENSKSVYLVGSRGEFYKSHVYFCSLVLSHVVLEDGCGSPSEQTRIPITIV